MTEALSKREDTILEELMDGGRVRSIADKLCLSPHTVKNHLRNIFSKLGVSSQEALIAYTKANPAVLKSAQVSYHRPGQVVNT